MNHVWAFVLAAPLFLQDDPVAAEALKGYQHPWAGFADQSTVTFRETIRRPDIDATGKLVYKDVTTDFTWTVVASAGERATFKVEGGGQESTIPFFIALPGWARGKGARKGVEEIVVGGVKRACSVTTIAFDADKDAGQVTTICKCADVPYWAVRWRTETLLQGKANTWEEEVVLEVDRKLKVGDQTLTCVVVESTVESVGGAKTVRKEWRCDDVPGRVVRREVRQSLKGKELESAFAQMEVVRFRGKR